MHNTKNLILAAALAAFTVSSGAPAFAQGAGHAARGSNRLDFLTGYLSLSDSQKSQAQTIFDAAATATSTARGQMTAARDALRTAIKANRSDAELDRLAAAVGVSEGQLTAIHAKAEAKFYALLTAEQKTKYDALGDRQGGPGQRRMRTR